MSSRKAQIGKKIGLGFLETVIHVCAYIIVIFLFIKAATLGYDFSYNVFGDPVMSQYNKETVIFEVVEGSTTQQVAKNLQEAELVKYDMAFRIRAKLAKLENSIIPGKYELSQSMTSEEILAVITTPVANMGTEDTLLGEDATGTIQESKDESETSESEESVGEQ